MAEIYHVSVEPKNDNTINIGSLVKKFAIGYFHTIFGGLVYDGGDALCADANVILNCGNATE